MVGVPDIRANECRYKIGVANELATECMFQTVNFKR